MSEFRAFLVMFVAYALLLLAGHFFGVDVTNPDLQQGATLLSVTIGAIYYLFRERRGQGGDGGGPEKPA
jgi:hypothetical protein